MYQWKWMRGRHETSKVLAGEDLGGTFTPVKIVSDLLNQVDTDGDDLYGVVIGDPDSGDLGVVIISNDIYQVQTSGDLAQGDLIQVTSDGGVEPLQDTNESAGMIVDYNPASGGIAHVVAHTTAFRQVTNA